MWSVMYAGLKTKIIQLYLTLLSVDNTSCDITMCGKLMQLISFLDCEKYSCYSHTSYILTMKCQLLTVITCRDGLRWRPGTLSPMFYKYTLLTSQVTWLSLAPSPPPPFWIKPICSYHIMAVKDLKKQHKYLIIIKKYKKREKVLAACQKYLTLSPDLGTQHVSMCIVEALA